MNTHLVFSFCFSLIPLHTLALSPVPQAFPSVWNGDRYYQYPCDIVQSPPTWLDGYFFCQLSASYGDPSNPEGHRVDHMFDAIAGLVVFDISPNKCKFTGAYYPTRDYKIWNFYDRDFAKSGIAWKTAFTKKNATATKTWDKIMENDEPHPNVDFWKIKNSLIAGTESYKVGLTFDIDTVTNFRPYPFKEASALLSGQPLVPMHMPIHERMDPDTGLLWATVLALNISSSPPSLHQVVFSVDENGLRRAEGVFDYTPWDPRKCSQEGWYTGGGLLPRLLHSITSTVDYIIIPLNSVLFNPCILLKGPGAADVTFDTMFKWDPQSQVTFLVFDKKKKQFLPAFVYKGDPLFIAHQFNAYEMEKGILVADMIGHNYYAYDSLTREKLISPKPHLAGKVIRFTLDISKNEITSKTFFKDDTSPPVLEFPQFNHRLEGKPYKYGYAVKDVYQAGNALMKLDFNDFTGKSNKIFQPDNNKSISFLEPYFVQRPSGTEEDDGAILARAYDKSINKTRVYVLDAKMMTKLGEILAPTDAPFGFHERFYPRDAFRMASGTGKRDEF